MKRHIILWLAGGLLAAGSLCAQTSAAPGGAERVALVIGNSTYPAMALPNPANDARDIAELLKQAGFQVDLRLDTSKMQLLEALQDFGQALKDKRTKFGVFYYAGHGAQQSWRNFLIPVDADVQSGDDVAQMAVDLSELTTEMARTRDRNFLMILDACRDDPFGVAYKPTAKGLTQYDAPAGSLLAYATGPGRVASDGSGRNGLYTSYLLRELAVKGARVEDAFKRVRLGVRLASRGRQIPWESTSLEEDLYVFPQPRRATLSNAEQEKLLDEEIDAWRMAKSANSVDALATFLREYPSGNASELALARLNTLLRQQAPRPRLAQLHAPDAPSAAPAEKMALAAASGSMPILRAMDEAPAATAAVAQPAAAPLTLQAIAPEPKAPAEPMQAPIVLAATPAQPAALAPSPAPATPIAPIAPMAPVTAMAAAPVTRPAPVPAAPAAPEVVAAVSTAVDAPQDLTVAATPRYQGSYEYTRRFQPGDVFRYQIINRFNSVATPHELRVTAVDPQKDEVTYNNGDYVSDSMGNVVKNQRGAMDSPRQFYPAELYVGKKWTTMFRQTRERGTYNTFKYQLKVVGRETVTVPAGRFNAFKIEARGFNVHRGAALERDIWVAPGVDADIIHETKVRLANGMIEQYDRQELVEFPKR
ncbi:caspase family protein [Variovorax sp. J22R133]|uniref:caspase family protein n=1 Tax=Variovorax brevis TaxID=3053503 RepID=UPI002577E720|nr:caspase family protein [Variovorax sp. J22R133]MDM0113903.1 caspase family protein [Variovorax sp. J22R133]